MSSGATKRSGVNGAGCALLLSAAMAGLTTLTGCSAGTNSGSGGGGGAAPAVALSTTSLSFGTLVLGTTSAAQTVTVTSSGAAVTISGVSVTGTNASSFAASSNCAGTLAAGAGCNIAVTLSPSAAGALSATLAIADNISGSPQTVTLSGTGAAPAPMVSLSSASLDFGSQAVGAPAISQTVTVSNTGNGPLNFSGVTLSGGGGMFSKSGTCAAGTPVNAGASCTVIVAYAPTAAGTQTATVTLADNAGTGTQSIAVTGTAYNGLPIGAVVKAGTLPVSGASVQLYVAGTAGNGSAGTALPGTNLTTSATGAVTLPGQYNCPTAGTQLYLVSRGGTVGAANSANSSLVLMSAVGACSQVTPGMTIVVNEATTVAAMEALAPFYSAGGNVGASATNATGLANAFATAGELVNPSTGSAPGATLPGNVTAPTARVNSLANAVNACAVTQAACGVFFSAATVGTGTVPANTLDALYNVVRNPASQVSAVYAASLTSTAYAPALTTQPTDWSMFLTLSGGGMSGPSGIGVDSAGNAWVASYFYSAAKFTPLGAPVFASGVTGGGLNNSYGLAMDLKDNAWIPNEQPNTPLGTGSVTEIGPDGTLISGAAGYTSGGMNYPISTAVDPNGTTWVVDYGNSHVTLLNALGTPISGTSGYTTALFSFPVAVVVDGNHFGWIANQSSDTVTKVSADGTSFTNYNCCDGASGLAIDQGNNVWVANYYGASVSLIASSGTVVSNGGYTGAGGLDHPQGIAIDGAGNVWVANFRQPYLTELSGTTSGTPGTALTPAKGYGADARLLEAYAIAVDATGSLWVTNFGNDTVTKFLGLATPVKTPLSGVAQTP